MEVYIGMAFIHNVGIENSKLSYRICSIPPMDGGYTVDVIKVDIGYWKFQLDIARNVRDIVVHGYWNL